MLRRALLVACIFFVAPLVSADPPDQIDFGALESDSPVEATFTLTNRTAATITARLSSTCPCVEIAPETVALSPASEQQVRIVFDPAGYSGPVERLVVITSDDPELFGHQIRIFADIVGGDPLGLCEVCEEDAHVAAPALSARDGLEIEFYADAGCAECSRLIEREFAQIQDGIDIPLAFTRYDVMNPAEMDRLLGQLERLNTSLVAFPVAIVGGRVYQGLPEIEAGILAAIGREPAASNGIEATPEMPAATPLTTIPAIGAIAAAGLIDGINPCAFSTILFLVSMLALLGHDRRRILTVGIVFAATIFVGYLAIGLGLLSAVRALMVFPVIARLIRWILVAVLVLLGILSSRDAILARSGRSGEMTLQLSDQMKRRIHSVMRHRLKTGSLVIGTIVIGALVTLFEFSCTGQVYVPVLMHLARAEGSGRAVAMIVLYNVMFIVPLVTVFVVVYTGYAVGRISRFFTRRLALVKALLAVLFFSFAVLTIAV